MTEGVFVGDFCPECLSQMNAVRAPSDLSTCEISAKSEDRLPSYGDFSNSRWPPSAILDFRGEHTLTIPDVAEPHSLRTHQIW